jgi:threonine dehydrogenase-like Zn-dependent dehydrogenase
MHVMVAKAMGATVLVSEPDEQRRQWAQELGADVPIDPCNEDLVERVKDTTDGKGVDAVVLVIGIAPLVPQTLEAVRVGGRLVPLAGCPAGSDTVEFRPNLVHHRESVLVGSEWIGTDVGGEQEIKSLLNRTVERLGQVDVLVNNPGVGGPSQPIEEVRTAEWDRVVRG